MIEDIACMKDIVGFVSNNLSIIIKDDGFYLEEIDLSQIIKGVIKELNYWKTL